MSNLDKITWHRRARKAHNAGDYHARNLANQAYLALRNQPSGFAETVTECSVLWSRNYSEYDA